MLVVYWQCINFASEHSGFDPPQDVLISGNCMSCVHILNSPGLYFSTCFSVASIWHLTYPGLVSFHSSPHLVYLFFTSLGWTCWKLVAFSPIFLSLGALLRLETYISMGRLRLRLCVGAKAHFVHSRLGDSVHDTGLSLVTGPYAARRCSRHIPANTGDCVVLDHTDSML